jgi:2OG-Fe(II) oxygenase superfamily
MEYGSMLKGLSYYPKTIKESYLIWELLNDIEWDDSLKSRQTFSYGVPYEYGGMVKESKPFPYSIYAMGRRVSEFTNLMPNNCLINRYRDGNDSMGYHSDDMSQCDWVAIVSLDSARVMNIKSKSNKKEEYPIILEPNSLLIINKEFNEHYLHSIPKTPISLGERISLSFRFIHGKQDISSESM